MNENLHIALKASVNAGIEILKIYNSESDLGTTLKSNNTPLTIADQKAHECIVQELASTGIPVLSEEGRDISYNERKKWETYWVVDPLDGTKEFIKRNGEFTVNIALMKGEYPIMGVIYVPVQGVLYYGEVGKAAFKIEGIHEWSDTKLDSIKTHGIQLPIDYSREEYIIVGSRSHLSEQTLEYVEKCKQEHGKVDILSVGSSLKICMVAEGKADEYPRFGPTMEWDVAAGQAIAEAAGAKILLWPELDRMRYNKEDLLNQWFLVKR